ncbi:uncharacterized protein LY79DRAFT_572680 [Colletotrichum navitas]|uniref:Uncharacterized protein n=1 Tax=Colletotrichum navitas TaxID=681940 RepID=A0AAD8PKD7_9PEZI|nr:uncharacterized protein LY79DRAFT_572680 [Colletotrichum navitas]KAK1566109.1 hypothetical protein LY79DRAFT_572680 [Colletotrichum navitas]
MDGLSNLDLNTADQATRRRVIETCNQHADYFRAQLDGRRPREREQRPVTVAGFNDQKAAIAGSEFTSIGEIDDKMGELLCAQERALQEALRHEMEIKRLWWLRQYALRGGK